MTRSTFQEDRQPLHSRYAIDHPQTADALRANDIIAAAARIRNSVVHPLSANSLAVLPEACELAAARAIPQIEKLWEFSAPLLKASLEALVHPFLSVAALRDFACKLRASKQVVGFVMPGNVPGAGLHELVAALLAGCGAIIKAASEEPVFFAELADALARLQGHDTQSSFASRIAIFNWDRERVDLTAALEDACDHLVVLGDDDTIAKFRTHLVGSATEHENRPARLAGFGSRFSIAVMMREAAAVSPPNTDLLSSLSRDASLFEQRGCLSPSHVFVEDPDSTVATRFAARFADAMHRCAAELPAPRRLPLEDAAAVRRVRESARWRALGGRAVRLWEGDKLAWTVVSDRDAQFTASPGFRAVYVSPFTGLSDLERRLSPVCGRLEACALAGPSDRSAAIRPILEHAGATYICQPGRMQSPPLDWPHGGGAFLRMLTGDA